MKIKNKLLTSLLIGLSTAAVAISVPLTVTSCSNTPAPNQTPSDNDGNIVGNDNNNNGLAPVPENQVNLLQTSINKFINALAKVAPSLDTQEKINKEAYDLANSNLVLLLGINPMTDVTTTITSQAETNNVKNCKIKSITIKCENLFEPNWKEAINSIGDPNFALSISGRDLNITLTYQIDTGIKGIMIDIASKVNEIITDIQSATTTNQLLGEINKTLSSLNVKQIVSNDIETNANEASYTSFINVSSISVVTNNGNQVILNQTTGPNYKITSIDGKQLNTKTPVDRFKIVFLKPVVSQVHGIIIDNQLKNLINTINNNQFKSIDDIKNAVIAAFNDESIKNINVLTDVENVTFNNPASLNMISFYLSRDFKVNNQNILNGSMKSNPNSTYNIVIEQGQIKMSFYNFKLKGIKGNKLDLTTTVNAMLNAINNTTVQTQNNLVNVIRTSLVNAFGQNYFDLNSIKITYNENADLVNYDDFVMVNNITFDLLKDVNLTPTTIYKNDGSNDVIATISKTTVDGKIQVQISFNNAKTKISGTNIFAHQGTEITGFLQQLTNDVKNNTYQLDSSIMFPSWATAIAAGAFNENNNEFDALRGHWFNFSNLNNLTSIGANAFKNCSLIKDVNLENTQLTTIEQYTFNNCANLTSFIANEALTSIGDYAFESCANLSNVALTAANSLNTINACAFANVGANVQTVNISFNSNVETFTSNNYPSVFVNTYSADNANHLNINGSSNLISFIQTNCFQTTNNNVSTNKYDL